MLKFVCFLCGFAEMAAIGSVISLGLSLVVSVVMLLVPLFLLVWALILSVRSRAARVPRARKSKVYVYVPPEQRRYPGQAFRPYVEPGQSYQSYQPQQSSQQYEEVW